MMPEQVIAGAFDCVKASFEFDLSKGSWCFAGHWRGRSSGWGHVISALLGSV